MGFRFQRRIRIAPGVRLNLSQSGIGLGVGRPGLRLGMDAKRRKYLSVGLPRTGLSYRTFFGRPVTSDTVMRVVCAVIAVALFALLVILAIPKG
jgi:hypothetical protein